MIKTVLLNLRLAVPKIVVALAVVLLGTALALLPWKWAATLLVAGGFLVVALVHPPYALCALAFSVPFGSIRQWTLGSVNVDLSELLLLLLLSAWLAHKIAARRILVPRAPLFLPLLLFLGAISLSILASASLELSLKELVKWLEVLALYWFVADQVDERWGQWLVFALLAAGSVEALVGVYQFVRRIGPVGFLLFGRFMRAYGHFAQPNPFAGYLGLSAPLAYALSLEALDVWRSGARTLKKAWLWVVPYGLFVASLGVMVVAMVMSWSRGGWVGLACAFAAITVLRSRKAMSGAVMIGLIAGYLLMIGGAQYLPPTLVQRVADFLPYVGGVDVTAVQVTDANWAVLERMAHWQAALGMFSDHLWLGVGIGNYAAAYPQYAIGRWQDPLGHAHNYYLNVAAEAGLVGLLAYLVLFVACFVEAWRVIRSLSAAPSGSPAGILRCPFGPARGKAQNDKAGAVVHRGFWRAVALGVMGILAHLSVHNLFDNLYVHDMNIQLALALGLLLVASKALPRQSGMRSLAISGAREYLDRQDADRH